MTASPISPDAPPLPKVAAVLVVHDGAEWLASVLATVAQLRYPALDLVVVDNGSRDGSAEILARRIPADRLLTLRRNGGFGRAVAAALSHPAVTSAEYLLLLHDDVVLAPDAVTRLVAEIMDDAEIGIVGPKLREWSDEGFLAEVGMTVDRFGRAESRIEPGELDQGQHDRSADVLYVNTAGMLLRQSVLRELGGFDSRYPAFRDDLDLCWRAWLFGFRVLVVPAAVGYHIGAGTRAARRFGQSATFGGRYLAERHSVATVLKNYGTPRLLWVLPGLVVLALVKSLVFVAIRRFGEAGAVARAYAWNAANLPRTLRRRAMVQRRRKRSDSELAHLFAKGLPRVRTYTDAFGAWLAGGSTRALIDDEADLEEAAGGTGLVRVMRERPALVTGITLLLVYLVGLIPLLGRGQVVGGDVAPWPDRARDFFTTYASPFIGDPLGVHGFSSPIQPLLGLLSFGGFGSAWLAQRLVVFGLLPLAWLLALRAGRLITARPGPRALGATLYVISPVLLGALAQGRFGVLVVAALLPGLVLVGVRAGDSRVSAGSAWRATALLALGLAAAAAASPAMLPLLFAGWAAGIVASLTLHREGSRGATVRVALAGLLSLLILSPWLIALASGGSIAAATGLGADAAPLPLWRAATVVPEVFGGLGGLGGVLTSLASGAVVGASIMLGLRRRPDVVAVLVAVGGVSAFAAWAVDRLNVEWLWAPALLLPTALAVSGLGVLAARSLVAGLSEHAFGARQLSIVFAVGVLAIGLVGGVARLATGPYDDLTLNPNVVPAFVAADTPTVGPYRVLLLADRGDQIAWSVTDAGGPSMIDYGAPANSALLGAIGDAVGGVAGGGNPRAGATLGVVNIRYLVVTASGASDELTQALSDQPALEPLPSGAGRVYRVRSWLPRASVLPDGIAERLLATGDPGDTRVLDEREVLRRTGRGEYRAVQPEPGLLLLSEATAEWTATVDGRPLERVDLDGSAVAAPVLAWRAPAGITAVQTQGSTRHLVIVLLQALLAAAVFSLALRPPRFTQRPQERRRGGALPRQLVEREPEVTA